MASLCVHLIDDDEAMLRAITFSIASAGYATRVYPSGEAFLSSPARTEPGCIVTDVRMPGMDGVELVRRLREQNLPHPVIVVTGHADIDLAVDAMKAGASDFLQKPFRSSVLLERIEQALATSGRKVAESEEVAEHRKILATLSPRQKDVLKGIVGGKLNKTIAHELGISTRTVESYRAEILSKTQAKNTSELVRLSALAGY
ncbi:MAG TPA: response regulator [Caulobacteraceae bacterium]